MALALFYELSAAKQTRILEAAQAAFAANGYEAASTNQIIKAAGIAKGSLFKYFKNKEMLYLDVVFQAIERMTADLTAVFEATSDDVFERLVAYSEAEFSWYVEHPEAYAVIQSAVGHRDGPFYEVIMGRYAAQSTALFKALLDGVDTSVFRTDPEVTLNTVQWFLKGFNEAFVATIEDVETAKTRYGTALRTHFELLKQGLYKPD